MNGYQVNDAWVEEAVKRRGAPAQAGNDAVAAATQRGVEATAWLQQCIPECCDELGVPHCRFLGAALMLRYGLGDGNVRRDLVKDRVRRLSPESYDDVYGAGAAAA